MIFSRLGEKADEVIKRLVQEQGSRVIVVTSDREVAYHAEKLAVAVIPSDQFREKMERSVLRVERDSEQEVDEERRFKKKGPSRMLSKREKRLRTALKKL